MKTSMFIFSVVIWFLFLNVEIYLFIYLIYFSASISETTYCEIQLDEEKLKAFVYAVKNHYWYQMYIDDLPIWGNNF